MEAITQNWKLLLSVRGVLISMLITFGLLAVSSLIFPDLLPFGLFEFWALKGSLMEAILISYPAYLFGMGLNAFYLFRTYNNYTETPTEILLTGIGISVRAGVLEEVLFRWLIFLSATLFLPVLDWLLLGFMGLNVIEWVYVGVMCPVANFFTLGLLKQFLLHSTRWSIGAALISANSRFRDGHSYQGIMGFTVSWFMGMYFFWLMFTYGLVAAILVHFIYDFLIFLVVWTDAVIERRMRRQQ